jgi:hypothetical protein
MRIPREGDQQCGRRVRHGASPRKCLAPLLLALPNDRRLTVHLHIVMSAKTALELGAPIRGIYSSIHLNIYVSLHAWILRISLLQ